MTCLLLAGILAFLFATLLPLILANRASGRAKAISPCLAIAGSLLFIILASIVLITDQPLLADLFPVAFGAALSVSIDRLAAFFIFLIAVVSLAVGIYSIQYEHGPRSRRWILQVMGNIFVLSMLLVVSAGNSYTLLFFWETMSVSSFFLVVYDYELKPTLKSGLFYFILTQLSTVFLLFAFVVQFIQTGSFDIGAAPSGAGSLLFVALFIGFGIKAGVMPFHKWLPYAHSASPSNISALMSGVMIKVAIYGILRFIVLGMKPELWWGIMILVFGSVSAWLGVIYALKEHDLKKLLAYHSIENIGIILLGLGLSMIFTVYNLPALALLALAGGLFHTLNHALFKSLLFLTAGSVVHATGTRNIEDMGGLVKTMPVTAVLFLVGSISISALPPFNGFVSELMIFQAFSQSFQVGQALVEVLLFVGLTLFGLTSALAAACFVKAFGTVFLAMPRSEAAGHSHEAPIAMLIGPGILAALCAVLGIFSSQLFRFAGYDLPTPDLLPVGLIMVVLLAGTILAVYLLSTRRRRTSETWGCGLLSQNCNMEYTASGFSEPILTIFRPVYRTSKVSHRNFEDKQNTAFRGGIAEIKTFKLFEERIYMPLARLVQRFAVRIADAQDVDIEAQILYAFLTIVLILVVMWWVM